MNASVKQPPRMLPPLLVGTAMLLAASLAYALKPTQKLAELRAPFDLQTLVPTRFGNWQMDDSIGSIMVNPAQQAALASVYRQTLARTYQNPMAERIMLSIAYGGDQSANGMQVHRPEFCYAAQGFQLEPGQAGTLATRFGNIPVTRLAARNGTRIEPMTYWITVGDKAYGSTLQKRLLEVEYSLKGTIPDGVIFRVSSIDADAARGYAVQDNFITELVAALGVSGRQRIAGLQPSDILP